LAIAGLVQLAGRVYTRAILHSGSALSLRDIWRGKAASGPGTSGTDTREAAPPQPAGIKAEGRTAMTGSDLTRHRWLITILTGTGVVVGVAVAVFTADVIIGVAAGASFIALANQMVRLWTDHRADAVVTPMAIAPPITLRATAARPRTGRPGPVVAPHHRITRQPLDRLQQ
jgi:hypothetical protein